MTHGNSGVDFLATRPSGRPLNRLSAARLDLHVAGDLSRSKRHLEPLDEELRRTHGLRCKKRAKVGSSGFRHELEHSLQGEFDLQRQAALERKQQSLAPLKRRSVNQSSGKTVRSFIVNFLSDDLGELKRDIDLVKHSEDTNTPITDGVLQELSDLHPSVESINLRGCDRITDIGLWALSRNCIHLKHLCLSGCDQITHIGLRSLSLRCSVLETLDLKSCAKVNDLGLRVVASGFYHLQKLCLEGCETVTDGGVAEIAKCCPNLKVLSLKGCEKISEFGERALVEIGKGCSSLIELDLTNCGFITDAGIRAVARGCNALEVLRVSQCVQLTGVAVRALGKGCQKLSSLGFGGLKLLRNEDIWWLSESLPKIKNLSLRAVVELRTYGIRGLCEYAQELQMLNLAECPELGDDSLLVIANSLAKLRSINICSNRKYTLEGVRALCHGCTRLVRVEAVDTALTRKGMRSIAADLPFVQVAEDRVALLPVPGAYAMIKATEKMRIDTAAAVCIQKMFRGVRARGGALLIRLHARRRWVIPQFQSVFRGYITRKKLFLERQRQQHTKTALRLQRYYRGHQGRNRARIARRIRALRRDQSVAAIRIQSVYRGSLGRRAAKEYRRQLALKALRACELRRKEEQMALKIQRIFRGRCGRRQFSRVLHQAEYQRKVELQRQHAATKFQSCWRMFLGVLQLGQLRAAHERQKTREAAARTIQTFFRCSRAKELIEAMKQTRQWHVEQESASKIQRCWRGCVGRQLAALMTSFEALRKFEAGEATKIQGWWRALQGRKAFLSLKEVRALQAREVKAATTIQRVFRSHKGREEREVREYLVQIRAILLPLYERKQSLQKKQETLASEVNSKHTWLHEAERKVCNMKLELAEICKHKAKYYDSSNITGALQRYQTRFLGQALRVQIETLELEIERCASQGLIELETNLRAVEKELREASKEVADKEATTTFDIRQNRAWRIREGMKKKQDSAKTIQNAYRAHRVKTALSMYGQFIGEYWDEEEQLYYYYNRKTRERFERMPWEYKVLQQAGDISLALGQGAAEDGWIRELDETSGYYYYYHPLSGEYRWEEPGTVHQTESDGWLQENVEQLTARSTKAREADDWVEYETEDGARYYNNETTGESSWTKPDGFDQAWVAAADRDQFEVSRTDGSQWQELTDDIGNKYYYNSETEESTWEKPPDFEDAWLAENQEQLTSRSLRLRDLNNEWQELIDPETQYTYYWNSSTGESRWSLPPEDMAPPEESTATEAETASPTDPETSLPTAVDGEAVATEDFDPSAPTESADEWTEHVDEETGASYFYNTITGESIWASDALFPQGD